ncbi:MAG: OmpA family protein [Rhodospirillaceae bacterium]|nr:OmpA family protein [Rhodospirillaceae bacterium]
MGSRSLFKAGTALAAAGLLSACVDSNSADVVRALPNKGAAFHQALQKDYSDLSASERTQADWADSVYYAGRARRAAGGETFPPQAVAERRIPAASVNDITEARARLMAVLTDDNRKALPVQASLAQTAFDCWMEQQEENFQPEDIAACKRSFNTALAALEQAVVNRPAAPTAPKAEAPVPTQFQIQFDFNSAALTAVARQTVTDIGAAYKKYNPATVLVVGHTDTAGAGDYNIGLSQKRAETVANALAAQGVEQKKMRIEAYGEERPAVKTGDSAKEQKNRRVDVVFEK